MPCSDDSGNSSLPLSFPHMSYSIPLAGIPDPIQNDLVLERAQYLPGRVSPSVHKEQINTSHTPSNSLTSDPGPSQ